MASLLVFDELQMLMKVSTRVPEAECRQMRRMLQQRSWVSGLREVICAYLQQSPELRRLHVSVSR